MTYRKQLRLYSEWLWSFIIRSRAEFICEIRGEDHLECKGVLQAMHLVTRGVKGIKYDRVNGRCGCQAHHTYYTYNPHLWQSLCARLWPEEWQYLNQKKWQRLESAIDKEKTFTALLIEAQEYKFQFPEYLEKFEKIESWAEQVAGG